jgi:hypothetical protein
VFERGARGEVVVRTESLCCVVGDERDVRVALGEYAWRVGARDVVDDDARRLREWVSQARGMVSRHAHSTSRLS